MSSVLETIDRTEFQTTYDTGEYIFVEGDAGDCAYIIESGTVEISLGNDDGKLVLATLNKGEILGEMAIIDGLPRTASARAVVPTEVTPIPLAHVSQKIEQCDPTIRMFLKLAMRRYRDLNSRLGQVFNELSFAQKLTSDEDYSSTTMELKNVVSQFTEMQKRIDSAVTSSSISNNDASLSEDTLVFTKLTVTEEKLLSNALKHKQFCLHYQPIVDLANSEIVGCEALVRWNHPSGELYPPSRFIAQAEESGLIVELGYWIAEESCRFQNRLVNEYDKNLFVSVNLSGKQFEDPELIPRLADIMDRSGTNPEAMKYEITESLLMDNPDLATKALNQLKLTGAKLAIDDFGTGYSSFSYLHRFPFDTLKIDRLFVNAMARSRKSSQIVKSLVNLSHDLGMDVIAEGIESGHEAELMRGFSTGFGQGYFYSKPVEEDSFVKLIRGPEH